MTKITIERSWKKQEKGRVQHLENLRQMQYKERAMIKEVAGITKIPLRWTSKKAHLIVRSSRYHKSNIAGYVSNARVENGALYFNVRLRG